MHIVDDFLDEDQRLFLLKSFTNNPNLRTVTWQDFFISDINNNSITSLFVKEASKLFNLSNIVGMESWVNYNTVPKSDIFLKNKITGEVISGWHYDRDETEYAKTQLEKFPTCSLVYYIEVKDLIGGNFLTKEHKIKPISNRLLVFGPGVIHAAEKFTGLRVVLGMALWDYKISL